MSFVNLLLQFQKSTEYNTLLNDTLIWQNVKELGIFCVLIYR
jgi:hypothetical protein